MSQQLQCRSYTPLIEDRSEFVNTITHGAGLLLSIIATAALIPPVLLTGSIWQILGCTAFGLSMVAVYAASTLSHAIQEPNAKRRARMWDQGLIYLLIAGSYTPFSLVYLATTPGLILLGLIWMMATIGFVSKVFFTHRIEGVAIWFYMLISLGPMAFNISTVLNLPLGLQAYIMGGGICYLIGIVFFVLDKREWHFHAIWHICVIAGTGCHYLAVLQYIAPASA